MGGDNSPQLLFEAVMEVSQQYPLLTIVVFAPLTVISELHDQYDKKISCMSAASIEFHVANEYIAMSDEPLTAIRSKKEASLLIAMRLLKRKKLDALVSIGNTGALVAAAFLHLPPLTGINKPALLATLPSGNGKVAIIDSGGNLYCKAQHLVQFAQMGAVYQRCRGGIAHPRVGLLNIGVESKKGTKELREAYSLLSAMAKQNSDINFIGNIEAREILEGNVDVVVTDGFTGNILLKATEGAVAFSFNKFRQSLSAAGTAARTLKNLDHLAASLDYHEYPGALICGVDGVVVKCHGSASARGLYHSIIEAISLVKGKLIKQIKGLLT